MSGKIASVEKGSFTLTVGQSRTSTGGQDVQQDPGQKPKDIIEDQSKKVVVITPVKRSGLDICFSSWINLRTAHIRGRIPTEIQICNRIIVHP